MKSVTVQQAVEVLNEALEADAEAVSNIINHRVPCSKKMLDHPTIQCGADPDIVGALGLLNGIFGVAEDNSGFIQAVMDAAGNIRGFTVKGGDTLSSTVTLG